MSDKESPPPPRNTAGCLGVIVLAAALGYGFFEAAGLMPTEVHANTQQVSAASQIKISTISSEIKVNLPVPDNSYQYATEAFINGAHLIVRQQAQNNGVFNLDDVSLVPNEITQYHDQSFGKDVYLLAEINNPTTGPVFSSASGEAKVFVNGKWITYALTHRVEVVQTDNGFVDATTRQSVNIEQVIPSLEAYSRDPNVNRLLIQTCSVHNRLIDGRVFIFGDEVPSQ